MGASTISADLQATLAFYKSGGAPMISALGADIQKDLQIATGAPSTVPGIGLQAYNLLPTALTLYPVLTPLRNMLPRLQGRGRQSEFKAILKIGAGPSGDALGGAAGTGFFGAEGTSGANVDLTIEDILAVYRSQKLSTGVSFEQQWAGQGFIDSKAVAVVNLLRQFMINEERALLFGLNSSAALSSQFSSGAVGTAAVPTVVNSGTGGSISGAGSLSVAIVGVTGMGTAIKSAVVDTPGSDNGGSTDSYTVTPPTADRDTSGFPILYWEIYAFVDASDEVPTAAASLLKVGNTNGAPVVITAQPTGAALGTTRNADSTADSKAYNGLYAQLYASATQGVGLGSAGATIKHANAVLAVSGSGAASIENLLRSQWNNAFADPRWMLANEAEARAITRGTLGAGTPYFVSVPPDAMNAATANFRVSRFTNPVTGSEVAIKVHPYIQQGSLITGSDSLPDWYVPTEIPAPIAADVVQDYTEIDYPPRFDNSGSTGDTWKVQVMNLITFKCFIPAIFGVLDSIVAS